MNKEQTSNRQLCFMMFIVIASFPSVFLSRTTTPFVGTGSWLLILISGLIAIWPFIMYTYLGCVHIDKSLVEYSNILVGKFLTYIFVLVNIISFFILFFSTIRNGSEMIKANLIKHTPISSIEFMFIILIYYLIINKRNNLVRFIEFFGVIFLLLIILPYSILITQGNLINLKPYFPPVSIGDYLKGLWVLILPWGGWELIGTVPLARSNIKNIYVYIIGTCIFTTLFYIFVVESNLSVIGIDEIVGYKTPGVLAVRRIELPFLEFFRRLDGLVWVAWIIGIFCTAAASAYVGVFFVKRLYKKANHNVVSTVVVVLGFIAALLPKNAEAGVKIFETYYPISTVISGILVPFILVIASKLKGFKADKKK